MKCLMVVIVGFIFVFNALMSTAAGPSATPSKSEQSRTVTVKPPKETRVSITGIVRDVSDTVLMVERTVKGKTEYMGFILEKPVENIKFGDKVRVSYIKKGERYIAIKVTPVTIKIIKKASPLKQMKASPSTEGPVKK